MRAEDTQKQWNGYYAERTTWDYRQPQDLVRGVADQQSVPEARPLGPAQYVGPVYQALADAAVIGQTVLELQSLKGFAAGDPVNIMLDDGTNFTTTIQALGAGTITLNAGLPYTAASGNVVCDTAHNPTDPEEPDGR